LSLAARVGLLGGKAPDMAEIVLFVAGVKIFLTVFVWVNEMSDVRRPCGVAELLAVDRFCVLIAYLRCQPPDHHDHPPSFSFLLAEMALALSRDHLGPV
jgi:hypothetical protein